MGRTIRATTALPACLVSILVILAVLGVGGAANADDEVVITEAARRYFDAGVRLLSDPDGARHEEAYRAFKAAFDESPSPQILGNIGLCAMKLERDGEAIEAYRRYLAEVERIEPAERSQIETDLAVLTANVVQLELRVAPAGSTITDERSPVRGAKVVNRYGPVEGTLSLGLRAGHHRFTVQHEGYETAGWSVELAPGQHLTTELSLKPVRAQPTAPAGPKPTAARSPGDSGPSGARKPDATGQDTGGGGLPAGVIVGLVATGALAVGAGITGGLALSKQSEFEEARETDREAAEDIRDEGITLNVVTDVLMGSAVAAAVVTAILIFTLDGAEDGSSASTPSAARRPGVRWSIAPAAGPHGAALFVVGAF